MHRVNIPAYIGRVRYRTRHYDVYEDPATTQPCMYWPDPRMNSIYYPQQPFYPQWQIEQGVDRRYVQNGERFYKHCELEPRRSTGQRFEPRRRNYNAQGRGSNGRRWNSRTDFTYSDETRGNRSNRPRAAYNNSRSFQNRGRRSDFKQTCGNEILDTSLQATAVHEKQEDRLCSICLDMIVCHSTSHYENKRTSPNESSISSSRGAGKRVSLACKHAFHRWCLDSWLKTHDSCPMCRAKVCSPTAADNNRRDYSDRVTHRP